MKYLLLFLSIVSFSCNDPIIPIPKLCEDSCLLHGVTIFQLSQNPNDIELDQAARDAFSDYIDLECPCSVSTHPVLNVPYCPECTGYFKAE